MERLPGFRDFYPDPLPGSDMWSCRVRQAIFNAWRQTALAYGFNEYDGPPLESLDLFTAKSGEEIVGQLYHFIDKGNRSIALRPEMTPTLARMVAAASRHYKKPLKWFAIPQLFRYERQQKGRLREHFQFNADLFGETDPAADAEMIALLIDSLRNLGLDETDFVIRLSSRDAWQTFFREASGSNEREYEFFQVIDKLERTPPDQSAAKLAALGIDFKSVESFIEKAIPTPALRLIIEHLNALGLGDYIKLDYRIVRGLAYYTGTVFEAFDKQGEFRAIAGGGRYDHLISHLTQGKQNIPALGFGMGDVVLTELLASRGKLPLPDHGPNVYFILENESERAMSLMCIQRLREAGIRTDYPLTPTAPGKQFKRAAEAGFGFTAKIEKENPGILVIKNMLTREEKTLPEADAFAHLKSYTGSPTS